MKDGLAVEAVTVVLAVEAVTVVLAVETLTAVPGVSSSLSSSKFVMSAAALF